MSSTDQPDPYRCGYCGALKVVASLARWCEQMHERDAEE